MTEWLAVLPRDTHTHTHKPEMKEIQPKMPKRFKSIHLNSIEHQGSLQLFSSFGQTTLQTKEAFFSGNKPTPAFLFRTVRRLAEWASAARALRVGLGGDFSAQQGKLGFGPSELGTHLGSFLRVSLE